MVKNMIQFNDGIMIAVHIRIIVEDCELKLFQFESKNQPHPPKRLRERLSRIWKEREIQAGTSLFVHRFTNAVANCLAIQSKYPHILSLTAPTSKIQSEARAAWRPNESTLEKHIEAMKMRIPLHGVSLVFGIKFFSICLKITNSHPIKQIKVLLITDQEVIMAPNLLIIMVKGNYQK